jgi:hypothetical protein
VATNFPASLDSLTNPTSSDSLNSPSHSAQHANSNDAIEALQAKVGADSSAVTSSLDYKVAQLEAISHGKILQVVSAVKNDTFSASVASGGYTAVTGLSATITPSSTSSKVVIVCMANGTTSTVTRLTIGFDRNGTILGDYDSPGSRTGVFAQNSGDEGAPNYPISSVTTVFTDSPASTSALTYQANFYNLSGSTKTAYINRGIADDNFSYTVRALSSVLLLEVSA